MHTFYASVLCEHLGCVACVCDAMDTSFPEAHSSPVVAIIFFIAKQMNGVFVIMAHRRQFVALTPLVSAQYMPFVLTIPCL